MRKITILTKRAALVSIAAGAAITGGTTTAGASEPAVQVPAAFSSIGTAQAVRSEGPVTVESAGDCTTFLELRGYVLTATKRGICGAASLPFPSPGVRIAICTPALVATGVGLFDAALACAAATGP
ncbi:hypothetical protein [Amycolatopsis kentuckyensis]|uniref:hypothetical protein n=1 Tax=Amycolatopsis kentuckyensis TaxID=218823 RepID=UPI001178CA52|nr:hypothetical protein [Amycolatopsis kentuckyensis]